MSSPTGTERAYGCVFCETGREMAVAEQIQRQCERVRARAVRQEKYHSHEGRKSKVISTILPGYVFIEAPQDFEMSLLPREFVYRVLTAGETWKLIGSDRAYAEMIFRYDGLLRFSQALWEGERVRIVSGPLKDMEAQIVRIDRRGRSGQVKMNICGKSFLVWLAFEWVGNG